MSFFKRLKSFSQACRPSWCVLDLVDDFDRYYCIGSFNISFIPELVTFYRHVPETDSAFVLISFNRNLPWPSFRASSSFRKSLLLWQNVNMIFKFVQNPFFKGMDRSDTENLLHSHIGNPKKTSTRPIACRKDLCFRILLAYYSKNMHALFFIPFQSGLIFFFC